MRCRSWRWACCASVQHSRSGGTRTRRTGARCRTPGTFTPRRAGARSTWRCCRMRSWCALRGWCLPAVFCIGQPPGKTSIAQASWCVYCPSEVHACPAAHVIAVAESADPVSEDHARRLTALDASLCLPVWQQGDKQPGSHGEERTVLACDRSSTSAQTR